MLPYIQIAGKYSLPLYGIVFVIGFFIAMAIARQNAESYGLDKSDVIFAAAYGVIGLLIGAKLLYFFTKLPNILLHIDMYWKWFKKIPLDALDYAFGGLVFYGGLLGAVAGAWIYCRKYKVPFLKMADYYAPFIPLVHGFGRIGCFLAGCCYGEEYHGFGSVQFPYNEAVPELSQVPRVPVQLLEAGFNFLMFFILFYFMKKKILRLGQLIGIYFLYYTIIRFLLEMLRGDVIRGKMGVFSTSQLISLILFPIAVVLASGKYRKKN